MLYGICEFRRFVLTCMLHVDAKEMPIIVIELHIKRLHVPAQYTKVQLLSS